MTKLKFKMCKCEITKGGDLVECATCGGYLYITKRNPEEQAKLIEMLGEAFCELFNQDFANTDLPEDKIYPEYRCFYHRMKDVLTTYESWKRGKGE